MPFLAIFEPYFYPRSPCGERRLIILITTMGDTFLSTLSLRRATHMPAVHVQLSIFLSTLSLRRATQRADSRRGYDAFLSTLSLRRATAAALVPRPPVKLFLSTLSLRRATGVPVVFFGYNSNFYPRSPCGERLWQADHSQNYAYNFYPRSPCGERLTPAYMLQGLQYFYPRSPCGERLCIVGELEIYQHISIHALLAESDI